MAQTSRETIGYRSEASRSKQLYKRALQFMPGGNGRHSLALSPYPIYVQSGKGCRVVDVEGEERIDFVNNMTQAILGHANPQVMEAVRKQLERGTSFAMPNEAELELASLLVERVGYIDKIRFCNSGSEAVIMAVKAARAFTGRHKIAKIEGSYHGIYDYAQVSESPPPDQWGDPTEPVSIAEVSSAPSVKDEVVVMPWNNWEACEAIIEKHKNDLAAVLIDPLPASLGMISPRPGFLESIRAITLKYGILMIADEVISFRINYHGASYEHGIKPDLTTLGKVIGGGFPVGAVGGSDDVMEVFNHTKGFKVHHAGTFNGNPITMTAGLATMKQLPPETYAHLNEMGANMRNKLTQLITRKEIPAQVTGKGSLFWFHLTDQQLMDYRSFSNYTRNRPMLNDLTHAMLGRGIATGGRGFGCISTPMGEEELDAYVDALDASLGQVQF